MSLNKKTVSKSILKGIIAFFALLGFFFGIFSLISSLNFALIQFKNLWPFIVPITLGFGLQFGLYSFIRSSIKLNSINELESPIAGNTAAISASGGISAGSMAACCAHFIPATLSIFGATIGLTTISSALAASMKYQKLFLSIGLISNIVGIFIMLKTIKKHNLINL